MIAAETWVPLIGGTKSEEELLATVQQCCAAWLPADLAKLPAACAHCSPRLVDDIPGVALALKRAELVYAGPADAASLLREMAHLFAFASEQLRAFRAHRPMPAWRPHRSYYGSS